MNKYWHRRARGGYEKIIGINVSQGETEVDKQDSEQDSKQNSKQDSTQNDKQDRRISICAMSLACMLLSLVLIVFHIMVSMRVIEYGNEVLYDKDDDYNSNDFTGMVTKYDGNDNQCLPIIFVVFFLFANCCTDISITSRSHPYTVYVKIFVVDLISLFSWLASIHENFSLSEVSQTKIFPTNFLFRLGTCHQTDSAVPCRLAFQHIPTSLLR